MLDGLFAPSHILIVGVIALVVLSPALLPRAARNLGRGLAELRHLTHRVDEAAAARLDDGVDPEPRRSELPTPNGISPNGHGQRSRP